MTTRLAECGLSYAQTAMAARGLKIIGRENHGEPGVTDVTVQFDAPALKTLGLPITAFGLTRYAGLDPLSGKVHESTEVASVFSADYATAKAALLKAYGKPKCDLTGTTITYCTMKLPDDTSAGVRQVTMSVSDEDGAVRALCRYDRWAEKK